MWSYLYVSDLPGCAKICKELRFSLHVMRLYTEPSKLSSIQIFSRIDVQTGGVHYYFSPAAIAIGNIVGAQPYGDSPLDIGEIEPFLSGHFLT
ncbi:hypothetical protein [Aeromonas sp. MdU4]|uniref:hypothetical protein n=1 Tax=Aeromonas sp. MdU4 TaxID=3342819 RepID=UPI0035BB73C5